MDLDDILASDNPRLGVFLRLGIEPEPARLWLGIGNIRAELDGQDVEAVDPTFEVNADGAIYTGIGELIGVPAFQQMLNGTAERVEFRLSGVSQRVIQLASSESTDVKGVPLLVGLGVFNEKWQLAAPPTWLKRLIVDYLSTEREGAREGSVYTVKLSTRSFLTGRRRPSLAFFTDAEQQSRSAGDRFCERTALYSTEVQKTWPRF